MPGCRHLKRATAEAGRRARRALPTRPSGERDLRRRWLLRSEGKQSVRPACRAVRRRPRRLVMLVPEAEQDWPPLHSAGTRCDTLLDHAWRRGANFPTASVRDEQRRAVCRGSPVACSYGSPPNSGASCRARASVPTSTACRRLGCARDEYRKPGAASPIKYTCDSHGGTFLGISRAPRCACVRRGLQRINNVLDQRKDGVDDHEPGNTGVGPARVSIWLRVGPGPGDVYARSPGRSRWVAAR